MHSIGRGGAFALMAALAFGLTTPLVQRFGRGVDPIPSATLLYAGAALVSSDVLWTGGNRETPVRRSNLGRLALVALVGAVVAPVCLTWGLQRTRATSASLLLNFEAVFTVLLAWLVYREPIGPRVLAALAAMSAGGACLVLGGASGALGFGWGELGVTLATVSWAVDNTLSRPLADLNPTEVVRWKAALGAGMGLALSWALRQPFPGFGATLALLSCGATGYGLSLRLYLLAQRRIGAARTGSIFALAPFVGAGASWLLGDRSGTPATLLAAGLFGLGVYLHLSESHGHSHAHAALEHEHAHSHDDGHHDHPHDAAVDRSHSHMHRHDGRVHDHAHAPDLHHRHEHEHEQAHEHEREHEHE